MSSLYLIHSAPAADLIKIQNYNMAHAIADQAAADEWIRYNEDIDPNMAAAADAAVKTMWAKHATYPSAHKEQDQEEELASTPTDTISLPAVALMVSLVGSLVALALHRFRSSGSTQNKGAFIAGYTAF